MGNVVDIASRLHLRASSFCMAQADHADNAGFNQGIASFMPNMTYLQPPGHVHAMVSSTWQPNGVPSSVRVDPGSLPPLAGPDDWGSSWNLTFTASAAPSDDKKTAVVRLHSNSSSSASLTVNLQSNGSTRTTSTSSSSSSSSVKIVAANATLLAAPSLWSANSPSNPKL